MSVTEGHASGRSRSTRITAVVPVWDRYVSYLPEAVASVAGGQGGAIDIVIVDNASTVPVPRLDEARVVRAPARMSAGAVRNWGLAAVNTPYVCFLDADDVLLSGTLAWLADRLDENPSAIAAVATSVAWDPDSRRHTPWRWPRATAWRRGRRATALAALFRNQFPATGSTLIRTAAVRSIGGFADMDYEEDWALATALAWRGRILLARRPGRLYRVHSGTLTTRHQTAADMQAARAELRRRWARDTACGRAARVLRPALASFHLATALWKARAASAGHVRLRSELDAEPASEVSHRSPQPGSVRGA